MMRSYWFMILGSLAALAPASTALAQSSGFTYQGRLTDSAIPATGNYDLQFTLYSAASGGSPVGVANTRENEPVNGGLFTVTLDFGASAFDGSERWVEIGVRPGDATGAFTILAPRQQLTAIPFPWARNSAGIFYGAGNVGIGATYPGEKLHLADGNVLMDGAGDTNGDGLVDREYALIMKFRGLLPPSPSAPPLPQFQFSNPRFSFGRINKAGDGWPEFRLFYIDDGKVGTPDPACEDNGNQERPVLKVDAKGIVASVKRCPGSHFEGFVQDGDEQPVFRLNSGPEDWPGAVSGMHLEMGSGGSGLGAKPDVSLKRVTSTPDPSAPGELAVLLRGVERLRIDDRYIKIPTITAASPPVEHCNQVEHAGLMVVRTDGPPDLYVCRGSAGWIGK